MDKLEFITPMYGNWSENEKRKIRDKQLLVKQIALESGSYYVFDTIIGKDVTMYLIAPKQKLIIWINHNMWQHTTKKLARVAEMSPIEHLSKNKVSSSIEVYGKNAPLANFRNVVSNPVGTP